MDIIIILKAILIGIVEGITEFIPVSSTGHMILAGWAIGFEGEFANMFEVVIQLGAILAVVVLYWNKIKDSVIEFFQYIFSKGEKGKVGFRFGINVICASIPIGIVGLFLYSKIKSKFVPEAVIWGFIVGGLLLLIVEGIYINKKGKVSNIDNITWKEAFTVGILQLLALWPGMSRSASTLMGGWIAGLNTKVAAEFSFFIAIPAMIGTSFKDLIEFNYSIMTPSLWIALIVGFVVAFIVSLVVIRKFIDYLRSKPIRGFAIYRVIAGTVLAILVISNVLTLN